MCLIYQIFSKTNFSFAWLKGFFFVVQALRRRRTGGWTTGAKPATHVFWNCTLLGTFSWEFSFVSFSKTSKTFLAQALLESRWGFCCKNTCSVSDFRIRPKLPQIETTFPLLYRTLLICMIHSCGSKTWIIGFSQFFPICKPYLTDTNLGGCIFSQFQRYQFCMSHTAPCLKGL